MIYHPRDRFRCKNSGIIQGKLLFFLLAIGILSLLFYFLYKPSTSVVSPIPQKDMFSFLLPIFSRKKNPDELKKKIIEAIGTTIPEYSVMVKDLKNDFSIDMNANTIFTGASVNKLPILGTLYYLAQKGDIDLDRQITIQPEDIQDYGTGQIRYDQPGTMYSVKTLSRLMMQKSDNTAAYILGRQVIGIPKIQQLITSWGMTQTDMENNKTSNTDIALLMEKIYREKVANKALTLEMLSFLKDGTIEDRIPALLPKETVVYHKTGNGVGFLHDVGIVVGPKTTYYIGMFTSGVPDEAEAVRILATISRIVYDFMK
ncbi:MAG: Beta-lactamase class A-like protein [Microgenomates group bacterium GW2011_GWC1_43_11]|uniref:Beta-lactamase class A-like protein n=4 Tax=Candidatus Gottesmaniibacteriota TaxID=1752720 RepID=A0A0G1J2P6_9BACT|nr:MAG: Beta-lactamase class A-like protein [Microgenomates group bacterium GW2011_GWC1_43_11]KKT38332.1 MAG: Beta-lactamase class A-like protein [Candidatus Gottesmanbacteria bacterium GW2011_GWB1_44_11c]HCM82559.1 hypothetical protein [Patescibacteria group bacterium]